MGNEGEADPNRDVELTQVFDHISTILESTTVISLQPNNSLTANLKDYAYP